MNGIIGMIGVEKLNLCWWCLVPHLFMRHFSISVRTTFGILSLQSHPSHPFPIACFFFSLPLSRCVICMCVITTGEELRFLPCFHRYHRWVDGCFAKRLAKRLGTAHLAFTILSFPSPSNCVDEWLLRKGSCPECGYEIVAS